MGELQRLDELAEQIKREKEAKAEAKRAAAEAKKNKGKGAKELKAPEHAAASLRDLAEDSDEEELEEKVDLVADLKDRHLLDLDDVEKNAGGVTSDTGQSTDAGGETSDSESEAGAEAEAEDFNTL